MNKETFEKKLAAEIESKRQIKPKVNDQFRFDDGTYGTVTGIEVQNGLVPAIEVMSKKFGYSTFAIASLTLYQAPLISNTIWTVED